VAKTKELTDNQRNEILDYIFEEMSNSNLSLTKLCNNAIGFFKLETLSHSTVLDWIEKFNRVDEYVRARDNRQEFIFEEMMNIADCEDDDIVIDDKGTPRVNNDVINRDRLRIETRKWMLGKMNPKKYGDKLDVTTDGDKLAPVTIINLGSGVKPKDD